MAIVLTGGSGTTATRIATRLIAQNLPVIVTSRNPPASSMSPVTAKFDWYDPSTYGNPFQTSLGAVESIYLCLPPGVHYCLPVIKDFIDFAHNKGVRRLVLMSSASALPGSKEVEAEEYIKTLNVEYCIIKPTWFTDNFVKFYSYDIKLSNSFPSATGTGNVAFVCANDIADLAVHALTTEKSYDSEMFVVGPERLSFDIAAEALSQTLGRKITHKHITPEELTKRYVGFGLTQEHGEFLASLEQKTAEGSESRIFDFPAEKKWIGKMTLKEFLEENKAVWAV